MASAKALAEFFCPSMEVKYRSSSLLLKNPNSTKAEVEVFFSSTAKASSELLYVLSSLLLV